MTFPAEPMSVSQEHRRPYAPDPTLPRHRRRSLMVLLAVCVLCLFYGIAFALFAPGLLLALVFPLPVMAIVAIWALPETRTAPTRTLTTLTFVFFVCLVMWPNYIAFAPPGLPWITMVRITGFPLVLTLLICVSVSKKFRSGLATALEATPYVWMILGIFVTIQTMSVGLSASPGTSLDKWIIAQVGWTSMFFVSAYVFTTPGRIQKMTGMLWLMVIPVGIIGIFEWRQQQVLWAGHIPTFLQIDDPSVVQTLTSKFRDIGYNDQYRTHSTFETSLGLGEYLALTLPFIIHYAITSANWLIKIAAVATMPFLVFIVYITGSRLAVVGCLMSYLFYGVAWAIMYWRSYPRSILAPGFLMSVPVVLVAFLALVLFSHTLHDAVLGASGATTSSTEARQQQLALAIPKFLAHPWGYGIGQGATTVGFHIQNGVLTLDSYYITVIIEYGLQGFIIYYGMIALLIFTSARHALLTVEPKVAREREYTFLIPLAIALANFFVIKMVYSAEDNHAIVFMFLGMIVALCARLRRDLGLGPFAFGAKTAAKPISSGPPPRAAPRRA